jgi:imidazoleglycerol-phosphate dehydratase / histidinol-phosphatase
VVVSIATLFIDRDGTLIEEPSDFQVDDLSKIRLMPGVIPALLQLSERGFRFVMVTNQDGMGSSAFPQDSFQSCQHFLLELFRSQGIRFSAIFICPHQERDGCDCRKPKLGLLESYLREHPPDPKASAVIGDRVTDLELAKNLGVRGLTVRREGSPDHTWPAVVRALTVRHSEVLRQTKETRIDARVRLDSETAPQVSTGIGFFDHMLAQLAQHGGFELRLDAAGDLHVDEHHTIEDCGLVLGEALREAVGDKRGIGRYGFVLPMDEAEARVAIDLSGRPFSQFEGRFPRDTVGEMPTELVPHFFRSLSQSLGAAIHVSVTGENTHHMVEACFKGVGRALRQALQREGQTVPSTKGIL